MTMLNKEAFEKACQKFDFMYLNSDGTMPIQAAIEEYEALVRYYPGPEPACRLALICKARGASQRATSLLEQVVKQSRIGGRHYQQLHGEWVALAQRELQG